MSAMSAEPVAAMDATLAEVNAGLVGAQVRLPAGAIGNCTVLLWNPFAWTDRGTAHPVGALGGTVKTIWSSPMQQPERP